MGGGHGPSHSVLYICILWLVLMYKCTYYLDLSSVVNMYIVPCLLCTNVHSTWTWHPLYICIYLLHGTPTATGDPMVPFYCTQNWVFISSDYTMNKIVFLWWGPRSLYIFVNIFTHDQPVDSFYPSNPKVSILSSPVLMYHITCTCILLCFLGALAQAFFCRQPTQGSYWCLNKHLYLVSCIPISTKLSLCFI